MTIRHFDIEALRDAYSGGPPKTGKMVVISTPLHSGKMYETYQAMNRARDFEPIKLTPYKARTSHGEPAYVVTKAELENASKEGARLANATFERYRRQAAIKQGEEVYRRALDAHESSMRTLNEAKELRIALAIAIKKLGGSMTITRDEVMELDTRDDLVSYNEPAGFSGDHVMTIRVEKKREKRACSSKGKPVYLDFGGTNPDGFGGSDFE